MSHFYFLKLSLRCLPKLVQRHKLIIPTNEMKPDSENFTISKVSAETCPSVADHPNTFDIIVLQVKNSVTMTTKTRKQLDHPFCGDCFMNWGSFRQIKRQVEKNGSRHPLNT